MKKLLEIRKHIRSLHLIDERQALETLVMDSGMDENTRVKASAKAIELIEGIRSSSNPGLMEVMLAEYGLSTDEGVALMCLAEALLRVPDSQTMDELIEDKIAPSAWGEHLGKSSSSLVNASTWALMLTGNVLKEPGTTALAETLHAAIRRLGEPVIRTAVKRAMKEMGHQFVLGEDISDAIKRGSAQEQDGFTYSYDMLGEAALTAKDADEFYASYADAIDALGKHATHADTRDNPGISIKLSALHPRYEVSQKERVMQELVPRVKALAMLAKQARMGFNIDAEEADRLDLSMDVIEEVLRTDELVGWDGFGVVVQAYGKRAPAVIDWLYALSGELDRSIMVRLVKGAYWDTEIKQAQVDGVQNFPVYTQKAATDVSYLCCARKLLEYSDRIYPQFATHNAHTISAIVLMAKDVRSYEFQRLHGMGETLHRLVKTGEGTRCRIYAPVGAHRDLLAYLVRRLLENGANSSFVNQIVDEDVAPALIAADPFLILDNPEAFDSRSVIKPYDLYQPERANSVGWDLRRVDDLEQFHNARNLYKSHVWEMRPLIAGLNTTDQQTDVYNPADQNDLVGRVALASLEQAELALQNATAWQDSSGRDRHEILNKAADLYEENSGEIFAALCREAGKTAADAIAEIREAVDFLRYYAAEAIRLENFQARGVVTCISPWNFPLAIFTGQIAAALAAGNGVIAKPADPTPIIASLGVQWMRKAGVPESVLQLVPGEGSVVGSKLTTDPRVSGICFTGSTGVAQIINRAAASSLDPGSLFIAETGGLNAMIVDSTALPEQAVKDIVDSAFRSCGQRCSALRVLYVQTDIADVFLEMLYGAMDELEISNPWNMSSDVGPIITTEAARQIEDHIQAAKGEGRLLKQLGSPRHDTYLGPAVIKVDGILSLESEIFGPVLHVCTFEANQIDDVVKDINACGYGLTFGLHTRIDSRVQHITSALNVGNMYVNRNQIGAVVGSQPFGGEGLSGTGPKAGGPHYVKRFKRVENTAHQVHEDNLADEQAVQSMLSAASPDTFKVIGITEMPGPTGESNRWSQCPRGTILCLGPTADDVRMQMNMAGETGCAAIGVAPGLDDPNTVAGFLPRTALKELNEFDAVALWSEDEDLRLARVALAKREGKMLPLITAQDITEYCVNERHLCIDTTAAGGNASLLAAQ